MRINNNISAMNTYSRLTTANANKSGSLAKLSSGLRINRAGDDAAGLAISEKMRGQIGGLKQSVRNAQDGISLIQTAEGALTETHSILNRMRELAVQASTDTNTVDDRAEIQKEIDELATEITRISTDTEFNTMKLLDGSRASEKLTFHIGANSDQNLKLNIDDMGSKELKVNGTVYEAQDVSGVDGLSIRGLSSGGITIEIAVAAGKGGAAVEKTTAASAADGTITVTLKQAAGTGSGTSGTSGAITATNRDIANALKELGGQVGFIVRTDDTFVATAAATGAAGKDTTIASFNIDEAASENAGINISTQKLADEAITIIDDAINSVSAERSKLGATQNRLEHTINNLTATAENLSEAESRIRDVDMAEEMMEFTKNNILSQAATSMLAQANQMPQSVLQLLQ